MNGTPIWVTLVVGVLGPIATILAVGNTTRGGLRKLREEQALAREVEERVQMRELAERRARFEIEQLRVFDAALLALLHVIQGALGSNRLDGVLFRAQCKKWVVKLEPKTLDVVHAAHSVPDRGMKQQADAISKACKELTESANSEELTAALWKVLELAEPFTGILASRMASLNRDAHTMQTD